MSDIGFGSLCVEQTIFCFLRIEHNFSDVNQMLSFKKKKKWNEGILYSRDGNNTLRW